MSISGGSSYRSRAVDSLILLVYAGQLLLDPQVPQHILCVVLCRLLADSLVDWTKVLIGLREQE